MIGPKPAADSRSLKYHMAVFGLGLALPAIVFVGIVLLRDSWSDTDHMRRRAEQVARDFTVAIDREISGITTTLEALVLAPSLAHGDLASFYQHATEIRRAQGFEITLRDPNGVGIAATRLPFGEQIATNPEELKAADRIAVATGRPYASDIVVGVVSGRQTLHVMVPARFGGEPGYVVSASVLPDRINDVLTRMHVPSDWTTAILDRRSNIIARHPGRGDVGKHSRQNYDETKASFYGTSLYGIPSFFSYDTSEVSGWRAVVRIPTSALEEPLKRTIALIVTLAVGLGTVTWIVTDISARRILSAIGDVSASAHFLAAGERVPVIITPIIEVNKISAALKFASDNIRDRDQQRDAVEAELRESEARYRILHESLRDAFVKVGMDGLIVDCNEIFCELVGYTRDELAALTYVDLTPDRWHDSEDAIVRDQILTRGYSSIYEKEYRHKNGTIFPVELRTILSRDAEGNPEAMWALVRDITARRDIAARMELMIAELQHRTRNLLAVVRSVASQTKSDATSLESFWLEFSRRLGALSRVQGLLSRSGTEPVSIGNLIRIELEALGTTNGQVSFDGPQVLLHNRSVQTLALALHELATNARKFGGLSRPDGSLDIRWYTRNNGPDAVLVVDWTETQGDLHQCDDNPPSRGSGYGRELIERALPYALGAKTSYRLTECGLRCTIELPLSNEEARDCNAPADESV
jgi:PAS domain S-box-containing protein